MLEGIFVVLANIARMRKISYRLCVEVTFDQAWIHGGLLMLE
jgi:hypothetical protein